MFKIKDRIKESSITEGNGSSIVLNDTFGGFRSFADSIGSGNSTFYTIENNASYEIGIGTYNPTDNSISRDVILESTNNNNRINLLGVSVVFGTYPGTHAFFVNDQGFASGQSPYYSGVAFPDGRVQNVAYQGGGQPGHIAFFTDQYNFDSNHYLTWNDSTSTLNVSGIARLYSDVYISGNLEVAGTQTVVNTQVTNTEIDLTTLTNTTFRIDDAAGCFFHAFVDNDDDNMVALYSTNESRPTWRLGLKDFSSSFTGAPSRGFIFGDKDSIGGVADNITDNLYVLNASNGFWVKHIGRDIFNVQRGGGINFYNDSPVVVPLGLQGAAGQSSNLQEWRNFSGSTLASVSRDGQISIPSIKFPDGSVQISAGVGVSLSGIIGSGTVNFIPKFSDTDTITDSVIIQTNDDGTSGSSARIGINTDNPVASFEVFDSGNASAGSFYFAAGNHNDGVGTYVVNDNYASGDSFYALGLNESAKAVSWVMMNDAKGLGTDDTFVLMKGNISSNDVKFAVDANGNAMIGRTSNHNFVGYNTLSIDGVTGSFIDLYATSAAKLRIQGNSSDATIQTLESIPLRFKTNQLERMTITETGDVGINTTVPTNQLEIHATGVHKGITIRGTNAPGLTLHDNGGAGVSYTSGGSKIVEQTSSLHSGVLILDADTNNVGHGSYMSLRVDGTERVQITEHGNVGIGVDPDLFISDMPGHHPSLVLGDGDGHTSQTIYSSSTSAGVIYFADGVDETSRSRGWISYDHNSGLDRMRFATSNVARMFIDSDGAVDIGTSGSPGTLTVTHQASGCGIDVLNPEGHGLQFGECAYGSYGSTYANDLYTGVTHTKLDDPQEYMLLSKGDHTFVSAKESYSTFIRSGKNGTTYQLMVTPSYLAVGLSGEMLKINSQKAEFNIYNENRDFVVNGSLDNLIYADASQNTIGINTDSPTSRLLTIRGKTSPDNNAAVLLQGSGVGTTTTDGFLLSQAHDGTSYVWNFETKPLIFANDNTERMRLESDGKLSHYGMAATIADGSDYELQIRGTGITLAGDRLRINSTETVINDSGVNVDFRVEGNSDPNLLFLDASADRVGIGTSSPLAELHIEQTTSRLYQNANELTSSARHYFYSSGLMIGGLLAYGSGYTAGSAMNLGSGTFHLFSNYEALAIQTFGVDKPIVFGTNTNSSGGERMRITGDGKIGIGTDNPTELLAVSGDAQINKIQIGSQAYSVGSNTQGITHVDYDDNQSYMIMSDGDNTYTSCHNLGGFNYMRGPRNSNSYQVVVGNYKMWIGSHGTTEKMSVYSDRTVFNEQGNNYDFRVEGDSDDQLFRVDASENKIGIGYAHPQSKLHVMDNTITDSIHDMITSGTMGSTPMQVYAENESNTNQSPGGFSFSSTKANGTTCGAALTASSPRDGYGWSPDIILSARANIPYGGATWTKRLVISSRGRVSIPDERNGAGSDADDWKFQVNDSTTTASGIFGIVAGTTGFGAYIRASGDGYPFLSLGKYQTNNWVMMNDPANNDRFSIRKGNIADNDDKLVIDHSGNVGIGTSSPQTKLDVSGVITASGGNSSQWNTAYGWGDHSLAGYTSSTDTGITGSGVSNYYSVWDGVASVTSGIINQSGNTLGINTPAVGANYTIHAKNLGPHGSWIINENAEGNSTKNTVFENRESGVRLGAMYSYGTAYVGGSIATVGSGGTAFSAVTGPVAIGPLDANKPLILGGGTNRYATIYASEFRINPSGLNQDFIIQGSSTDDLLYADASTDRVGIGTSSPSTKLEVANSGNTTIRANNTSNNIINILNVDSTKGYIGTVTDHDLGIGTNSTTRIRISNSGNVGIGTVTPAHKLDVSGMGRFVHADGDCGLQVEDTGGSGVHIGDCAFYGDTYAGIKHSSQSGSEYMIISRGDHTFMSAKDGKASIIRGGANNQTYQLLINNVMFSVGQFSEKMKIDSQKVEFNGSGNLDFVVNGSTLDNLIYADASADSIGIGTATPAYKLDVADLARFQSGIIVPSNTILAKGNPYIQLDGPDLYDGWLIAHVADCYGVGNNNNDGLLIEKRDGNGTYPDGGIIFANRGMNGNSVPSLSINGFGHVSIGKMVSPFLGDNNRLVIESGHFVFNGDNGNYDFKVHGDTQSNMIYGDASTNCVGIGTDAPVVKLHVHATTSEGTILSQTDDSTSWAGLLIRNHNNQNVASFQYGNSGTTHIPSLQNTLLIGTRQSGIPVKFYQGAELDGAFRHNNERIIFDVDGNTTLTAASGQNVLVSGVNLGIGDEGTAYNGAHRVPLSISPIDYAVTGSPNAAQQTNKIRVYDREGNGIAGFGVSTSCLNIATSGLIHQRFYTDATLRMTLEHGGKLEHYGTEAKIADGSAYELDISSSAATLGGNRLQLKSTETVFNEAGTNTDFRIEGDSQPYLLHVDAGMDNIAIGRESVYPEFALTVYRTTNLDDVDHLNSARGIYSDINHHTYTPGDIYKYSIGNSVDIRQHLGSGVVNSGYVMGVDANGLMTGSGYLHHAYGLRTYAGGHENFPTAGRIKNSYGVYNRVLNLGSGTMDNAYGEYITISAGSNGTIGNAYGIYIEDNAGTIASGDYGIYQNGASACNYFAGSIGVGTFSPSGKLHIQDGTLHILNDGSVPQFELVDTDTDNTLRLNSTNSVFAFNLDPDQKIAGSELRFNVDNSDKFILKHNINEFKQSTQVEANNNLVQFGNSITIINGNEENIDLQVKGDSDPYLLYCDASTDRVGIGTATPAQVFDVTTAQLEIASFNYQSDNDPVGSGERQSLIVEQKDDTIITKHLENTSNGSTTLVLKNLIRYGADFVSIDDAYSTGLGTTYNPKLLVNTDNGYVGIGTDSPTQKLDIDSSGIRIRDDKTPASASATGNKGEIAWDSNYVYVCVATNTWKRSSLSTW